MSETTVEPAATEPQQPFRRVPSTELPPSEVPTGQQSEYTARYCPEAYVSAITGMLWRGKAKIGEGKTFKELDQEIARIVGEIAGVYGAGNVAGAAQLVDTRLPELPLKWSPTCLFRSMAAQMAMPIWSEYTDAQKTRAFQYAARHVQHRLKLWLSPPIKVHPLPGEQEAPPFSFSDLNPRQSQVYAQLVSDEHELRKRLTMVQAYLATHPDDEFDPAQLRRIVTRWSEYKEPQAFF